MKKNRINGFDFIRTFAIFFVFMAHIFDKQCDNSTILLIERAISPGLTMSLLGFISGYLLSKKYKTKYDAVFYIKRFSRIYSSLFSCLSCIVILHIILSYDVVNQHSIIHYMGLSFFIDLLQVENNSSIGAGLWFITIINMMYLILPLLSFVYIHKNRIYHLTIIIISCLFLNWVMYSTASAWNVVIAFNIGCYVGLNYSIEKLSQKSIYFYAILTIILIITSTLATSKIIPYEIRSILFPVYPIIVAPLFFKIGNLLTGIIRVAIGWFSSISYEVYIIHFYFINNYFADLFPNITSLSFQIIISILMTSTLKI